MKRTKFLQTFLKDASVASVTPTSKHAVKKICSKIDFVKPGMIIVEYGAGSGVVSIELLKKLPADGKLILIEQNAELANHLREIFADPRVIISTSSAEHVATLLTKHGIDHVDAIISSIPFTFLPPLVAKSIIEKSAKLIGQTGVFVMFQFNPKSKKLLKQSFGQIKTEIVPLNVPPLIVWQAKA